MFEESGGDRLAWIRAGVLAKAGKLVGRDSDAAEADYRAAKGAVR
jgi:hypothetical protein